MKLYSTSTHFNFKRTVNNEALYTANVMPHKLRQINDNVCAGGEHYAAYPQNVMHSKWCAPEAGSSPEWVRFALALIFHNHLSALCILLLFSVYTVQFVLYTMWMRRMQQVRQLISAHKREWIYHRVKHIVGSDWHLQAGIWYYHHRILYTLSVLMRCDANINNASINPIVGLNMIIE